MILNHQHFDLNGKIVLERVKYSTPMTVNRVMQDEACLLYNVKGNFDIFSQLNKETIKDRECMIMKCGQYFTSAPKSNYKESSEVVAIHFYPDLIKLAFNEGLPKFLQENNISKTQCIVSRIVVDTILNNYIDGLLLLFENPALVTDELIVHKVKEIILILLNTNSEEAEKIKEILSDIFNPSQVSFKEIINSHCYNPITIKQLAFLCNMSISTFKRRFLENYGRTPASYIREKRMKKAAHLLKNTNESIASICYDVGFSDTSNFTKAFASHFNTTPNKFRKQTN
ncbi:helix-turn-helix domain-containing protein [Flagellimonas meridianipacifica]|uniref:AraC-like DNA-binding protein n=1 Tax=Flagellimonas meridianipacifica TaxID=1080225 RepID=A0A2T0MJ29_9FLAO|nr:AraC family transcriptional regulator [Allomuricauda pacifica]PRX57592.1 AraC-like DNA-binding protein [Allomuricauda pacifica]